MIILNASQNRDGTSSRMAHELATDQQYQQINLVDYHIDQIGQVGKDDELKSVVDQIKSTDKLIITTPVYWSDMPGYLKTFIDRSGNPSSNIYNGIQVYLIVQGFEPDDAIQPIEHVVKHWAIRDHMQFMGIATNLNEINRMKNNI